MLHVDNFSELLVEIIVMSSYGQDANTTVDKLISINSTLNTSTNLNLNSIFLGGGRVASLKQGPAASALTNPNNAEKFMKDIFTQGGASPLALNPNTSSSFPLTNIVLLKDAKAYSNFAVATSGTPSTTTHTLDKTASGTPPWSDTANINPNVVDVNLYGWCDRLSATAGMLILQKLYLIHDLFGLVNWTQFIQNKTVYLNGFNVVGSYLPPIKLITDDAYVLNLGAEYDVLNSGSPSQLVVPPSAFTPVVYLKDLKNIGGDSKDLIDFNLLKTVPNLNTLLFRRLFYLWIRMAQYKISNVALATNPTGQTKTDITNIRECQFRFLYLANQLITTDNSFSRTVFDGITQKQNVYRSMTGYLQDLNAQIDSGKKIIVQNQNNIKSQTNTHNTVKIFEYIFLTILFGLIAGSIAIGGGFVGADKDSRTKYSVFLLLSAIIFVTSTMLIYQHFVPKETFANAWNDNGGQSVAYDSGSVDDGFMKNVMYYTENTITAVAYLQAYEMVQNINNAMSIEKDRYVTASNDIQVSGQRLHDISNYIELGRIEGNSRVYMFIAIILIIGFLVPVYIWAEDYPTVRFSALGVASLFVIIAMVIQGYQSTSIVRTNSEKKYWGHPNTNF
jgi:hypothetical protein